MASTVSPAFPAASTPSGAFDSEAFYRQYATVDSIMNTNVGNKNGGLKKLFNDWGVEAKPRPTSKAGYRQALVGHLLIKAGLVWPPTPASDPTGEC